MVNLKKIRQQEAFKVPENYFSNFENRLMNQVSSTNEESATNWFQLLIYQLQLRFSIPATMVACLALIIISISLDQEKQSFIFTDGEINSYLLDAYDDELETTLYAMTVSSQESDELISDDEILEYLYEENVENELIEDYLP